MIDQEITKINQLLKEYDSRITSLENQLKEKPATILKKMSIKEFLLSKNCKDDVEKTITLIYFLEKYDNMDAVNSEDVTHAFRSSKETIPSNVPDKLYKLAKRGLIMENLEKRNNLKGYTLTNSGEKFVEETLRKS